MEEMLIIGKTIKNKRLLLNMRMDDLAKKTGITRATVSSIENGKGNCSALTLLKIMSALGLSFSIGDYQIGENKRNRATRINTKQDKKINRFVVMCVEQYANSINKSSASVYKKMSEKGIIKDLTDDYEDLHGMSFTYLIDYINSFLDYDILQSKNNNHQLARATLIVDVVELISNKCSIHIDEARNRLYDSKLIGLIDDDETGLYGESPLYLLSLYEKEVDKSK